MNKIKQTEDCLKYFFFLFYSENTFHSMQIVSLGNTSESICMECRSLFSGANKKNITNLLSAEFAQRVAKVKN